MYLLSGSSADVAHGVYGYISWEGGRQKKKRNTGNFRDVTNGHDLRVGHSVKAPAADGREADTYPS